MALTLPVRRPLRVSEKVVKEELRRIQQQLGDWIEVLEKVEEQPDNERAIDVTNYCAELSICAAKIEALVTVEVRG